MGTRRKTPNLQREPPSLSMTSDICSAQPDGRTSLLFIMCLKEGDGVNESQAWKKAEQS